MNKACWPKLQYSSNAGQAKCAFPTKIHFQIGITYIEVISVVVILGILAAVAIPNLSSVDHKKLDLAAEEVAQAIRFARIESIRTAVSHGVIFNTSSDNAKVYRLLSVLPTYDVYHPVSKKIFILNLRTDAATAGVELQSYGIYYGGSGINNPYLGFSTDGNPKFSFFGTDYMLDSATVTLSYAGQTRVIKVAPMTGRVIVQ
jgi:Tfp pilus assembly protein FimT